LDQQWSWEPQSLSAGGKKNVPRTVFRFQRTKALGNIGLKKPPQIRGGVETKEKGSHNRGSVKSHPRGGGYRSKDR